MNKQFDVIPIEDYFVVVDKESEIPQYSWFYASDRNSIHDNRWKTYEEGELGDKKDVNYLKKDFPFYWLIIATIGKRLEGIPLVENVVEEDINSLAILNSRKSENILKKQNLTPNFQYYRGLTDGFVQGFKAAQSKGIFTEKDMINFARKMKDTPIPEAISNYHGWYKSQLQSLQKKVIKSIVLEVEHFGNCYAIGGGIEPIEEKVKISNLETNIIIPIEIIYD